MDALDEADDVLSGSGGDTVEANTSNASTNEEGNVAPAVASVEVSPDDATEKSISPMNPASSDPPSTVNESQEDEQQQEEEEEEEDKPQPGESGEQPAKPDDTTNALFDTGNSKSDDNVASTAGSGAQITTAESDAQNKTAGSDIQNTTPTKQENDAVVKEAENDIADGEEKSDKKEAQEKPDKKEAQEKPVEEPEIQPENARISQQLSPQQQSQPHSQSQPQPRPQQPSPQPQLQSKQKQQFSPPRPPSAPTGSSSASTEIVHSLFGPTVGLCWGDFSCQYNHVRGRLYASEEAVLFYSNIFGFEKRISLPYDDVLQMQLYRATSIQISVQEKKQQQQQNGDNGSSNEIPSTHYVFKGFSDRSQTLQLLIELWRQSQGAENIEAPEEDMDDAINPSSSQEASSSQQAGQANTSASQSPSGMEEGNSATTQQTTNSATNPPSILRPSKLSTPPTRSASPARMDASSAVTPSRLFPDLSSSSRKRSKSLPQLHRRRNPKRSSSLGDEDEPTASTTNDDNSSDIDEFNWDAKPSQSDLEAWNALKKNAHPCVKEVGIKPMTLACSLGTFFKLFLADEAPHSVDKYQRGEAVKDLDVKMTPWEQDPSSSDPKNMVRTNTFRHPVSSSFGVGPSHAPTRKRQLLRGYPGCGICLTNSTTVEGLPGADCFEVKDQWIIEVAPGRDGNPQVKFSTKFGANFTKYTFLKGIIHKNIRSGNIEWFEGYKKVIESAVKEKQKNDKDTEPPSSDTDLEQIGSPDKNEGGMGFNEFFQQKMPINTGTVVLVAVGFQIVMLLFLFVVVHQMQKSQQTSESLLEELLLLRREHGQMLEVLLADKAPDA